MTSVPLSGRSTDSTEYSPLPSDVHFTPSEAGCPALRVSRTTSSATRKLE